jgi:hypothetical protein
VIFAVVAALLALPGAAAAQGRFVAIPAISQVEFHLRAAHGYNVRVSYFRAGLDSPSLGVHAEKGPYSVEYSRRVQVGADGRIDTKLPGVGRINVRFIPTEVRHRPVADNCKGAATLIKLGVFRGRIAIHGAEDYTHVVRDAARGKVIQEHREVCDNGPSHPGRTPKEGEGPLDPTLIAGDEGPAGITEFSADRFDFGPNFGGSDVLFAAHFRSFERGLLTTSSAAVSADPSLFSVTGTTPPLEGATVAPPAPFHGSASFHLDTPTSASWTGDLGVELPGVGPVALTGPEFRSGLCAGQKLICTKTLPRTVQISSFSG